MKEKRLDLRQLGASLLRSCLLGPSLSVAKATWSTDSVFPMLRVRCHGVELVTSARVGRQTEKMEEGVSDSLGYGQSF